MEYSSSKCIDPRNSDLIRKTENFSGYRQASTQRNENLELNSVIPSANDLADVPAWVTWIAQDRNGAWWGYSVEPQRHDSGWYENEVGHCIQLALAKDARHWQDSLLRVNHGSFFLLREACLSDLPSINQVIESAIMSWNLPERVKRLSLPSYQYDERDLAHMHLVVAENREREIIGVYALDLADSRDVPVNESALLLHGIYVMADKHHQGIGQALFAHAENQVRSRGKAGLLVKAQPGAIGFFRAQNMVQKAVQDTIRDYPYLFWKRIETDDQ